MKLFKKIILITMVLMISTISVSANDASSDVTVSYTPDKVFVKVSLEIEVQGMGTLFYEKQPIREGILVYEIQDEDTRYFSISPDDGYEISQIEYSDGYQSTELQIPPHKPFSITIKDQDAKLFIKFSKNESQKKPENNPSHDINISVNENDSLKTENPLHKNEKPLTEDNTHIGITVILLGVSLLIIVLIYRKKENETHKEGC